MLMSTSTFTRFARYLVVGLLSTAMHFLSTIAFVEIEGMAPAPASVAGFMVTIVAAFFLHSVWTFDTPESPLQSFLKYALVSLSGLALNTLLMFATTEWLHWHYIWGLVLVVLIVPPWNFVLNLLWSFRQSDG